MLVTKRILIVEDSTDWTDTIRNSLSLRLSKFLYLFEMAKTYEDARNALGSGTLYDLVFLDPNLTNDFKVDRLGIRVLEETGYPGAVMIITQEPMPDNAVWIRRFSNLIEVFPKHTFRQPEFLEKVTEVLETTGTYFDKHYIRLKPIWGLPNRPQHDGPFAYVLLPDSPTSNEIFEQYISRSLATLGITAIQSNDLFGIETQISQLWSNIFHANYIIADCTGRDPNVFYQLGIAHTLGKPVILITQDNADIPFDLLQYRHIKFTFSATGFDGFSKELRRAISYVKRTNKLRTCFLTDDYVYGKSLWNIKRNCDDSSNVLFMIMPFRPELTAIYKRFIIPTVQQIGLAIHRGDDFFTTSSIMSDVFTGICRSRLTIADCTGRNPNVYYEMGIAHTLGKSVVILSQSLEDIPTVISSTFRVLEYKDTPNGMTSLNTGLTAAINTLIGQTE